MNNDSLKLTPADVSAIEQREQNATPGPWAHVSDMPSYAVWSQTAERDVVHSQRRLGVGKNRGIDGTEERDAVFIAAARQDIPNLVHDWRVLSQRVQELQERETSLRERCSQLEKENERLRQWLDTDVSLGD